MLSVFHLKDFPISVNGLENALVGEKSGLRNRGKNEQVIYQRRVDLC